jgi:hypothetical protein
MGFYYARCTIFRGSDCGTDHYLVVAKFKERLAVSKQAARKFDGHRFKLSKLNDLEIVNQGQFEITKRGCIFGEIK